MVIERLELAEPVIEFESVAFAVKVKVPAAEGVPEIVQPENDKPVGNDPEKTAQLSGDVPPLVDRVWVYANPCVPPVNVPLLQSTRR
jgi:hypothetical protein